MVGFICLGFIGPDAFRTCGIRVLFFSAFFFSAFPFTLDASAWYSHASFAALAIFAVVVLYAFRYSLGGRPLIAASQLDD